MYVSIKAFQKSVYNDFCTIYVSKLTKNVYMYLIYIPTNLIEPNRFLEMIDSLNGG